MLYSDIAPYLVHVNTEEVLDWLRHSLWGTPWGFFILAPGVSLDDLCRHFQQFVMVLDPDGEEIYFRFYDPRVMSSFLPTCLSEEVKESIGPVGAFGMVEADSGMICWWRKR